MQFTLTDQELLQLTHERFPVLFKRTETPQNATIAPLDGTCVQNTVNAAGAVVLAERERCAVICENEYNKWDNERPPRICATAIRKG